MSTRATLDMMPDAIAARPPLALIAGPTASGKSDLAVRLALRLREAGRQAVIVNADSAQVYRDLRVLSARPTPDEMLGVPHRLFGTWDGARACSAADWAVAARVEITAAHARDIVPIMVGGTGLYFRTLLDGIAPIPAIEPSVRSAVRGLLVVDAFAALSREDPTRAAHLAPGDSARVRRALEVIRSTGRPLADWQAERAGGIASSVALHPLILMPGRDMLYRRCDARFAAMLDDGAISEVAALLARGLDAALPVMRAIGVREIAGFLAGEWTKQELLAHGGQATRRYAKRQMTWFRNQASYWSLGHENDDPMTQFETLFH